MTIDELAARMEEQFAGVNGRFAGIDNKFVELEKRFDGVEKKVDEGFKDSKIRDEELRDLMKFGLEAREVLRDEMHRRFDETDRKHDQQIGILKDVIRQSVTKP